MTHSVQYSYYNFLICLRLQQCNISTFHHPIQLNIYYDHFEQYNNHITDFFVIYHNPISRLIHSLCIRNYFCCIFFYSDDFHKDTLSLNSYYNNDFLICKLIYGL